MSIIKKDSNKKYWIIGIILILAVGIYFVVTNIDFNKLKSVKMDTQQEIEVYKNSNLSIDLFGLGEYMDSSTVNIISIIMILSILCVVFGGVAPIIWPREEEYGI